MMLKKLFSAFFVFSMTLAFAEKRQLEINIHVKTDGSVEVQRKSELLPADPEKRFILVKNSDTGTPIAKADVDIDNRWKTVTNDEGKAPLPDGVDDGSHRVTISKEGEFARTVVNVVVEDGEIASNPQVSMPPAVDYERIKIVLDWGESPDDLDSHITSSFQHVYYSNMNSGNLSLDRDDTSSFGPETVTVRDIDSSERYSYYVLNYSDRGYPDSARLSASGAQVRVFVNNELAATFSVPRNRRGVLWHVFDIVNGNEIVEFNTISNERM